MVLCESIVRAIVNRIEHTAQMVLIKGMRGVLLPASLTHFDYRGWANHASILGRL